MPYLLSIVIPTKNRHEYLKESIQTLLALDESEVEIVICDNTADNAAFLPFIEDAKKQHHNVVYIHSVEPLSQTENSDLALSHASGEYCCYIGDDDSVLDIALDITKRLKTQGKEACVFDVATYHWPDVVFEGKAKPTLSYDLRSIKVEKLNATSTLNQVLSNGIQDIKFLPRVYHGIVSKRILEKVKAETGTYFPGPSPDMANAIAVALLINEYYYFRAPVVLSGYSYKSAGGMGLRGAHKGSLRAAKQLSPDVERYWTPSIPKIWLGYTIWMEAGLKALEAMHREDLMPRANKYAMYAKSYLRYPEYRKQFRACLNGVTDYLRMGYECAKFVARWSRKRLAYKVRVHQSKQYLNYEKEMSLTQACQIVNNSNHNIGF